MGWCEEKMGGGRDERQGREGGVERCEGLWGEEEGGGVGGRERKGGGMEGWWS